MQSPLLGKNIYNNNNDKFKQKVYQSFSILFVKGRILWIFENVIFEVSLLRTEDEN